MVQDRATVVDTAPALSHSLDSLDSLFGNPSTTAPGEFLSGFFSLLRQYRATYYGEDPLHWLVVPYILLQRPLAWLVKKTQVYEKNKAAWKRVMVAYNLGMSAFSAFCVVKMLTVCWQAGTFWRADSFDEKSGWFSTMVWLFYVSKYMEFCDTIFLILAGRPVSWLQWFHHTFAVILGSSSYYSRNGGSWIGVSFNGAIHVVMYYYYACTIMKWSFPWKQMITNMQLVQFVVMIALGELYSYWVPEHCSTPVKFHAHWFWNIYLMTLIGLFANFYMKTYMKSPKKRSGGSGGKLSSGCSDEPVASGTGGDDKYPLNENNNLALHGGHKVDERLGEYEKKNN